MTTRCRACQYSSTPFCAKHQAERDASPSALCVSLLDNMIKEDRDLLAEIDDDERSVTTWESGFLASSMEWLDAGRPLTQKQRAKAREILEGLKQ